MSNIDAEIIVSSYHTYSDLWDPFFFLFKRYWPDCPYKVHLVTDCQAPIKGSPADEIVGGGSNVILCGDINWAQRILHALTRIKSEYVILTTEDFLLCDYVENRKIDKYLSLIEKYNAGVLYLGGNADNPFVDRVIFSEKEELIEYKRGSAYRIIVTPGIWRVSYLKKLLGSGCESIWDFEKKVSFTSNDFEELVIGTINDEYPSIQAVLCGKWDIFATKLCGRCGIDIDFSKRSMLTDKDYCVRYLKSMILKLNPVLITKISNWVHIGK